MRSNNIRLNKKDKKAQLKIQEMAFVLVAIMIFFAIVTIFYINIRVSGLRENVQELRGDEAKELVRKLAGSPEFAFTAGECVNCIDLDKALLLKDPERKIYQGFWNLDYLKIELIYPEKRGECSRKNYPDCSTLTLINKTNYGIPEGAFVALCRYENSGSQNYIKCDLGKIYAAGKGIE